MHDIFPRARIEGLTRQSNGDELLVHDAEKNHFHTLNATAAAVWAACDGTRDIAAIATVTKLDADVVGLALDDLAGAGLMVSTTPGSGLNRREVVRKLAAAGVAGAVVLPVIASITSDSALAAGTVCVNNGQCQGVEVCILSTGGFCGPCLSIGVSCVANSECCSGFCDGFSNTCQFQ